MFSKSVSSIVFFFCFMEVVLQNISYKMSEALCGRETEPFDAEIKYLNQIDPFESTFNGCATGNNITSILLLSKVSTIGENTFVNMPQLSSIIMEDKEIRFLKPGFVKNTPNLKELDITSNMLSSIPNNAFNHLDLDSLELAFNKISFIEAGAFGNLRVDELNLSHNKLTKINGNWFSDSWIKILDLHDNQVTNLYANTFKAVNGLEVLLLGRNKIYFIEDNPFSGPTFLKRLDLNSNVLANINFLNDTVINFVDLSFNMISNMEVNESMRIGEMVIYPNPWNCKCLRKFWKYAWKHGLKYSQPWYYNNSDYDELKKLPVCVVHGDCDSGGPEVLRKYFKFISYNKFYYVL